MISADYDCGYTVEDWAYRGETAYDLAKMGVVHGEWPGSGIYPRRVSEDFYLSLRCRELGHRIYVDPRLQIGHIGALDYLKLLKPGEKMLAQGHH